MTDKMDKIMAVSYAFLGWSRLLVAACAVLAVIYLTDKAIDTAYQANKNVTAAELTKALNCKGSE